jgi:hypothetical protein
LSRVDLSGHDRRSRFILREKKFAKSGTAQTQISKTMVRVAKGRIHTEGQSRGNEYHWQSSSGRQQLYSRHRKLQQGHHELPELQTERRKMTKRTNDVGSKQNLIGSGSEFNASLFRNFGSDGSVEAFIGVESLREE